MGTFVLVFAPHPAKTSIPAESTCRAFLQLLCRLDDSLQGKKRMAYCCWSQAVLCVSRPIEKWTDPNDYVCVWGG